MEQLARYLATHKVTQQALAVRAGVAPSMIGLIKSGRRRPSPEVAKRIEAATDGEVKAAALLDLGGAEPVTTRLGPGRWLLETNEDGYVRLPPELLAELLMPEGGKLLLFNTDGEGRLISAAESARRVQARFANYRVPGRSVVDEFIAERRAEAAREASE